VIVELPGSSYNAAYYRDATFVVPVSMTTGLFSTLIRHLIVPIGDATNTIAATSVKDDRYPHICPRKDCGKKAYVGFNKIDCSSMICNHYAK
jgi:hypothetical protein